VYRHDDGRPLLGRKLKGKLVREMAYLGLTVDRRSRHGRQVTCLSRQILSPNHDYW
jgi:hypothetical protein